MNGGFFIAAYNFGGSSFVFHSKYFIVLITVIFGNTLLKIYNRSYIFNPPDKNKKEIYLLVVNIFLNSLITFIGFVLWKEGIIKIVTTTVFSFCIDLGILFFAMDFAMYILHRIAHISFIYPY